MSENRPWWVSGVKATPIYHELQVNGTSDKQAKTVRSLELIFSAGTSWAKTGFILMTSTAKPMLVPSFFLLSFFPSYKQDKATFLSLIA